MTALCHPPSSTTLWCYLASIILLSAVAFSREVYVPVTTTTTTTTAAKHQPPSAPAATTPTTTIYGKGKKDTAFGQEKAPYFPGFGGFRPGPIRGFRPGPIPGFRPGPIGGFRPGPLPPIGGFRPGPMVPIGGFRPGPMPPIGGFRPGPLPVGGGGFRPGPFGRGGFRTGRGTGVQPVGDLYGHGVGPARRARYLPGGDDTFLPNPGIYVPNPGRGGGGGVP